MLTTYNGTVFNSLNPFQLAKQQLTKNRDLLPQIGAVICKHGLQDVIGVTLLHKHFNIFPGEVLIEKVNDNTIQVSPNRVDHETALVPYIWAFSENDLTGERRWFPLEFTYKTNITAAGMADRICQQSQFLKDMADKLDEIGLAGVFGITTLHRDLVKANGKDDITLETTDDEARILTIAVKSRDSVNLTGATQTLWRFKENFEIDRYCGHCCHHYCDH